MKALTAIIVSAKTAKTAVVAVSLQIRHPLYRKLLTKTKKYKVDTNGQSVIVGQTVRIVETRPISKDKYFKIIEVVDKTPRVKLIGEERAMSEVLGEEKKPRLQSSEATASGGQAATTASNAAVAEGTVAKSVRIEDKQSKTVVAKKKKEQVL